MRINGWSALKHRPEPEDFQDNPPSRKSASIELPAIVSGGAGYATGKSSI